MINELRAADEQKMLRHLQRLSRKGRDLGFRGQRGETPVVAHHLVLLLLNTHAVSVGRRG